MPQLVIDTNLPNSQNLKDFVLKAAPLLSKILGMPEKYCMVSIKPDTPMSLAGSTDPCAHVTLSAVGLFGVEENRRHVKPLYDLIEKELNIKGDRIYLFFNDVSSANAAHEGKLLLDILGK